MNNSNLPVQDHPFDGHIVGVGASAGGLDALEKFFNNAPSDSGLAFVVVQHLSPDYKSLMADLLSKRTDMPVIVAEDGMPVEPDHVYLIPPRNSLTIFHRKLYLAERETGQLYLPIDIFLQSLADDLGEKAIGVILSGTGSDGTRGIRAIKEKGGLVIVQDEQSAKFDGMPRSAIATNLVDYVLQPEHMIREMLNYIQHPCLVSDPSVKRDIIDDVDTLNKVFSLLRASSGVDFALYKSNTVVRRIERRMGIKQIEKLGDYLQFLYQSPSEVSTLYRELLIGVTRFFRDPEAFKQIRNEVIPAIFTSKQRGEPIRVWVAGCSTGEEAYSLAILLTEYMEVHGQYMDVKVFATDLDKNALEFAGKGVYPESIAADVSPEYLHNYFVKDDDTYTVTRRVREMVIFAQQNVITDPPFSKVDLISCRNVLIYLQAALQKKVIAAFQFALNPDGFLVLGTSETVSDADDFFTCRSTKWKIYQYKGGFRVALEDGRLRRSLPPNIMHPSIGRRPNIARDDFKLVESIQRGVIDAFLPPTVVVDEDLNLIYTTGDVDAYLRIPTGGVFTANILKQAREGLSIPLSTAIHKVFTDQEIVTYKNIHIGATVQSIDLVAHPFTEPGSRQRLVFVQFNPVHKTVTASENAQTFDLNINAQQRIKDLEYELQHTRESLQATVEELETSNEELQATNEELFAANEELQSTNEELHSVNEELITVNAEYHAKIQELGRINEDMSNFLTSIDVGTVFLDRDLRVRRFTSLAQREINLVEQDLGRPINHVTHHLLDCDLVSESLQVLNTEAPHEKEVQNSSDRWYLMRFQPFYTMQKQVGGVIITFVDITDIKQANTRLTWLSAAIEQSTLLKMMISLEGLVEYVNLKVNTATNFERQELLGKSWQTILSPQVDESTRQSMQTVFQTGETWMGEVQCRRKGEADFWVALTLSSIRSADGELIAVLFAAEDITRRMQDAAERKLAEDARRESEQRYHYLVEALPDTAILLFDAQKRYLIAGGQELARAGFVKERIQGATLAEAFPSHVVDLFDPLYDKALAGEASSFEHVYSDQAYHQTIVPVRNWQGEIYAGMVVAHNVTDRVSVEDELRDNLEKYQVLFHSFPLGITVADRDGNIIESNLRAENILGISRQEHTSRTIDGIEWQIIRPDGTPMPASEYASVRALKENCLVENVEMGLVKGSGDVTWISVTAAPLKDGGVVVAYKEIASHDQTRAARQ